MNMLEFVTVKDNILEFLSSNQDQVIDSHIIYNDLKFICQPNGVVDACIEEMEVDKMITIHKSAAKDMVAIADSGVKLLAEGGYSKRLITEKKIILNNFNPVSNPVNKTAIRFKRKKQINVMAGSLGVVSVLSSILFKRI
jgi:hypothetical protein